MSPLESVVVSGSEETTGGLYALILLSLLPLSYWLFHRKGEWQELPLHTLQLQTQINLHNLVVTLAELLCQYVNFLGKLSIISVLCALLPTLF